MEEGNHSTDSTTKAQPVVELEELFTFYASHAAVLNSHRFDRSLGRVQERCNALFARDYEVHLLSNPRGELCDSYPVELIIPQQELFVPQPTVVNEGRNMEDLFVEACWARSRSRFPVPVLIFNNRNICRSGALAEAAEIGIRSKAVLPVKTKEKLRFRGMDAEVLRKLSVTHICDLMVDHKMKVMGVTTATSEHLSAEIYANDFTLVHIPYPGVDLYKTWSIGGYNTQGLCANWNKMSVQISVPSQFSFVEWRQCTSWGMITLTQNYLKTMLSILVNPRTEDKGLLVHCVSGWDRTPLWISLLRLSLWADGVVHHSLSAEEMLYLTVGYDWLLFGFLSSFPFSSSF
ncbi:Myotubularin-related protein 14 [Balamuthia mandrillaris]